MVAVLQKGVDGTVHDHAKNCLNRRNFFVGKATACGINLGRIVDTIGRFQMQKSNARKVKSARVHGAPLKTWTKQKLCA
jgi:hypothetical protein